MEITVIDVIDTAIKIGLGGIIGFISTYIVTKLNHQNDHKKELLKRKFDSLEQVASNIEEFSHIALKYWALIAECVRLGNSSESLSKEKTDLLEIVKSEYFSEAKFITTAESKLLLLGLKDASIKLRLYIDFLKKLRRHYYVGKPGLKEQEIDNVRNELLKLRHDFFAELALAYKGDL